MCSLTHLFRVSMSPIVAHDVAYYDTNILHCNINIGSIMISEGGEGFLIDWDMYVCVGKRAEPSGRVERTVGICPLFQDCLVIDISLVL